MFKTTCGILVPRLLIDQSFFTHNPLFLYQNSYNKILSTYFSLFFVSFLHIQFNKITSVKFNIYTLSTQLTKRTTLNKLKKEM